MKIKEVELLGVISSQPTGSRFPVHPSHFLHLLLLPCPHAHPPPHHTHSPIRLSSRLPHSTTVSITQYKLIFKTEQQEPSRSRARKVHLTGKRQGNLRGQTGVEDPALFTFTLGGRQAGGRGPAGSD